VHRLLHTHELLGADQQVIYAAINTMNVTTKIQTYQGNGGYPDVWFTLGMLACEAGKQRKELQGRANSTAVA
jgi:hypothetical protein